MIQKLATLAWFAARPSYWSHATALILRKLRRNLDAPMLREAATQWAAQRAKPVDQALSTAGIGGSITIPELDPRLIEEGQALAKKSQVRMGGPGDLGLIYATVTLVGATAAIETASPTAGAALQSWLRFSTPMAS